MFAVRSLQERVLDMHKLTAVSIVPGGYSLLWRTMMIAPLINSIIDAGAILSEMLEVEKDILSEHWYCRCRGLYES